MNNISRREACIAFSALAALAGLRQPLKAEEATGTKEAPARKRENVFAHSKTFSYNQLPVTNLPNGGTMRKVISGVLPTGEYIEVHESMLPPGKMPIRRTNIEIRRSFSSAKETLNF